MDIVPPADVIADLTKPWPWPESSVDEVRAHDIFEHLPDKRHTMNELYRVLKPNATAIVEIPCAAHGAGAFQDPTHVSYWTGNDFTYWEKGHSERERFRNNPMYGVRGDFQILDFAHTSYAGKYDEVWKFHVMLRALK